MGYSFRLTTRVLLYAPSHRQDSTYHGLCYTSRGALAGTRNTIHNKTKFEQIIIMYISHSITKYVTIRYTLTIACILLFKHIFHYTYLKH